MSSVIGITVGTPLNPEKIKKEAIDPIEEKVSLMDKIVTNTEDKVSLTEKRVTNLEAAVYGDLAQEVVDDSVAHTKNVPAAAKPYARVDMIGGMTCRVNVGTEEAPEYVLRSAKVTEVKSVGVNLLPLTYETSGTGSRGEKIIVNPDLSIDVSGKPTGSSYNTMATMTLKAGTYTLRDYGTSIQDVRLYVTYGESTTLFAPTTFTLNEETSIRIRIAVYDTFNGNTVTIKPLLVRGSVVPKSYTRPVKHTLPIPEAVRSKPWYGLGISKDVRNAIRYNEDGGRSGDVKCAEVDLGTLNWITGPTASGGVRFHGVLPEKPLYSDVYVKPKLICSRYDTVTTADTWNDKGGVTINSGSVEIKDSNYTDAATFKAAMSGVMLVYELATPTTEDISDILPADNYIGVEGGGTLTFVNEYGYDVPSEVTFVTKEVQE